MSFLDNYLPDQFAGYGWVSAPRFKTSIQVTAGGNEGRNQEWEHPLHRFVNPEIIARPNPQALIDLKKHWLITKGPAHSFPISDPHDKASVDHEPNEPDTEIAITATDQVLGIGDGFTDSFQLVKTYTVGAETYDRPIYLPVIDSLIVAADGIAVAEADYTATRPGGIITFDTPPANGVEITAGFLFDVEVRFESDDQLELIMRTWQTAGAADLTLIEVRRC
jgi:uncharacterized protein (TIGR02217 family)